MWQREGSRIWPHQPGRNTRNWQRTAVEARRHACGPGIAARRAAPGSDGALGRSVASADFGNCGGHRDLLSSGLPSHDCLLRRVSISATPLALARQQALPIRRLGRARDGSAVTAQIILIGPSDASRTTDASTVVHRGARPSWPAKPEALNLRGRACPRRAPGPPRGLGQLSTGAAAIRSDCRFRQPMGVTSRSRKAKRVHPAVGDLEAGAALTIRRYLCSQPERLVR